MRGLIAALRRGIFRLRHARLRETFRREDPCSVLGFDLVVSPGVLHPKYFPSSSFLARFIAARDLRGEHVLDIGTGSGILALIAARNGAVVTAIDVDPKAVQCARANLNVNGVPDAHVLQSDVFDRLPGNERFDLIVSNPPFYAREARDDSERAFAAGSGNDFFRRLAAGLDSHLSPEGTLLMVHTSDAPWDDVESFFRNEGFRAQVVGRRRTLFETLTARELSRVQRT